MQNQSNKLAEQQQERRNQKGKKTTKQTRPSQMVFLYSTTDKTRNRLMIANKCSVKADFKKKLRKKEAGEIKNKQTFLAKCLSP